jgi:hypothetical protein
VCFFEGSVTLKQLSRQTLHRVSVVNDEELVCEPAASF